LEERTRLIRHLEERNIFALFHYIPLHSSPMGKKLSRASGPLGNTEDISQRLVRLPLYFEMENQDIDRVIEAVGDFYKTK